jgi:hypothetical protein
MNSKIVLTGLCVWMAAGVVQADFVHPGVFHTQEDLDRMKAKVAANEEPWLTGYNKLAADSHSSSTYSMQGPSSYISRNGLNSDNTNLSKWENDCGAVYQNAIMWVITGNQNHKNKAVQILNGWSSTCASIVGADARLTAGLQGHKFITAAEIIRRYNNGAAGWTTTGINNCSNFIRNVLLPQNRMYGGGNWGNCGAISEMAAGIFLDDEALFNEAVNTLKYGAPSECDMGMINYIDPGGWTTEADRDIGHWALGLMNLSAGASIAWCQGVDLWNYLNQRLLVGHEYLAEYNLGNTVAYNPVNQCDEQVNGGITTTGRGRWDLFFWEQAYYAYQYKLGYAAPFTEIAVAETRALAAGAEGYDRDHVAFGTIVFALDPRTVGLPVVPAGLTAIWGNGQVVLNWTASSGAASYNVKRATTRGGTYTTLAAGVTATSYTDSSPVNNTLYYYRVSAVNGTGETINSGLAIAYPSSAAPAAPMGVTARTTSHARIDISWNASIGAASYNVKRATVSGGPYTTIATGAGTTFLSYANTGLPAGTQYYYVVSAVNGIGQSADSAQAGTATLPALPAPWTFADAGYLTTPGNATFSNNTFTVKGAGLDYGGYRADAFGFAYKSMTGNGAIIARYASRQNYSHICKVGLTMRESLSGGSKHAFVLIDGADSAGFIYRTSTGGSGSGTGSVNVAGSTPPEWLKLERSGSTFTGSVSTDGTTWTQINSVTITMNSTILVGFAVCSRNNGYLDTATFDNITAPGWAGAAPPAFLSDPFSKPQAIEGKPYSGSLASDASDPDAGDLLTFSKQAGPTWLTISSAGLLSGTPANGDVGANVFTVKVQDQIGLYDTATMNIAVANVYSGSQGLNDLLGLAAQWLMENCSDSPACNGADLTGDAIVDLSDLAEMARNWQTGL